MNSWNIVVNWSISQAIIFLRNHFEVEFPAILNWTCTPSLRTSTLENILASWEYSHPYFIQIIREIRWLYWYKKIYDILLEIKEWNIKRHNRFTALLTIQCGNKRELSIWEQKEFDLIKQQNKRKSTTLELLLNHSQNS